MVELCRRWLWILLLVMAAPGGQLAAGGEEASPGRVVDGMEQAAPLEQAAGASALDRFLARPDEPVRSFRARRRLWSEGVGRSATMEVLVELHPDTGLRWEVLAEKGSRTMRNKGFRGMLEKEAEAYTSETVSRSSLTTDNYELSVEDVEADGCVRLRARPRRRETSLVDGAFLVTPDTSDLVRVEGRLARGPSFWMPRVEVVRHYRRIQGHRVLVRLESTAHIRLLGQVRMVAEYEYEMIDGEEIAPRDGATTLAAQSGRIGPRAGVDSSPFELPSPILIVR